MPAFFQLLKRFRKDERGVFGVIFGILAVVLIALAGCVVDFSYMQTIRSRAQTALDASALALQAKMSTLTDAQIKTQAQSLLIERLADNTVTAEVLSVTRDTNAGTLNIRARIAVPTTFVQLVGVPTLNAQLVSEVTQSSSNLEVSLALDITQSMNMPSSKIQGLRDATSNLIDQLVKDQQPWTTPASSTFTRMAFAPFSYGVNVSTTYIGKVRGAVTSVTGSFTTGSWAVASSARTISTISKNSPYTVTTSSNHGLSTGDTVYISGVSTITSANNKAFTIKSTGTKTFTLNGFTASSSNNGTGGTVTKCASANCDVTISGTSIGTNFKTGDGVLVSGVNGYTALEGDEYFVTVSGNNMVLLGSLAANGSTATTVNGSLTREDYGDAKQLFTSMAGGLNTFSVSPNCVTERVGAHAYDDTAPGSGATPTVPVGFMYPSTASNCISSPIVPLTDDKTRLHDVASHLSAAGSTAGHIGLAWAWYLLSPNFGYLFTGDNDTPARTYAGSAYGTDKLVKAVILMTDGAFNTAYCKGVISDDSDVISGTGSMINCDANNNISIEQAKQLCTAIKASGGPDDNTLLYTVGFDIGTGVASDSADDKTAQQFLSACSTDPSKFYYLAQDATDLDNAFKDIGNTLSDLRLSK